MEKYKEKLTTIEEGLPSYRKIIRLPASIGDWTTLRPPRETRKKVTSGLRGFDRLSEKSIESAHLIHYRFFCDFIKHLSKNLETSIQLDSIEAIQTYYMEFIRKSVQPLVHVNINLKNNSQIYLFIDLSIANSIINRALSNIDSKSTIPRGLTEAEEEVLLVTINEALINLGSYFNNVFEISDISIKSSPAPNIESNLNPNDTFIVFQSETSIAGLSPSKISIGYIYSSLRGIMEGFQNIPQKPINYKKLPAAVLDSIVVDVAALLGTSYITTNELNEIEEGDVIITDSALDMPNKIFIGNEFEIYGEVGTKNGKMCIKISTEGKETREISEVLQEQPEQEQEEEELPAQNAEELTEELTEEENIFGEDFSDELGTEEITKDEDKEFDLG